MTEKELVTILEFISDAYPRKFEFPRETKKSTKMLIHTWYSFLQDYDPRVAFTALKKLIVNNPEWPPAVGQVVQAIEELRTPPSDRLTGAEAWQMVLSAIRHYGTNYGIASAMNILPPKVRKTVECVGGLRVIGRSNEEETFMMNRFIKVYQELSDKHDRQVRLPASLRKETEQLADKFTRPALLGDV